MGNTGSSDSWEHTGGTSASGDQWRHQSVHRQLQHILSGFFKIQIHSEILKTMPKLLSAWYDDITNPSIHKLQELIFKRMRNICVKS